MVVRLIVSFFAGLAVFVAASPTQSLAPLYIPQAPLHDLIANRYIVVLKDSIPAEAFDAHVNLVEVTAQASPLWGENGLRHVWDGTLGSLKGYSGLFSENVIGMIRQQPEVDYVEQTRVMRLAGTQTGSTWGLHRISHRESQPDGGEYEYVFEGDEPGKGVMAYVLDSGIRTTHEDFEGRARWGITTADNSPDEDDNGHGTLVAGVLGGMTFGIAKYAELTAVKVLDADGACTSDGVVAGVVWADKDASSRALMAESERKVNGYSEHKGSVINMSLGGAGHNQAISDSVKRAIEHGHTVVVAAGNDAEDACNSSPSDIEETITVGATTPDDTLMEDSNWGSCVDIFAPGHKIRSTYFRSDTSVATGSGTSMSAPHVSGVVAYLLSIYPHSTFDPQAAKGRNTRLLDAYAIARGLLSPYASHMLPFPDVFKPAPAENSLTPAKIKKAILDMATWGKIDDPKQSNNAILFNNVTGESLHSWGIENTWITF